MNGAKIMQIKNNGNGVFAVQHSERLADLEGKMKRVVSAWMAGALTDREFTDTLLLFAAMVEEPRDIGMDFFEEKIDGVIRKALERVKDGTLWHPGYSKSTKQALGRVFG